MVGVCRTTVIRVIQRGGKYKPYPWQATKEEIDKMVELYISGYKPSEIASILGRDPGFIRKKLRERGIKPFRYNLRPTKIKIPQDEKKIIYLAGLFDGEGYVSIGKNSNKPYLLPQFGIANTSKDVMEWLVSNFGGKYYKVHTGRKTTVPGGEVIEKYELAWRTNRVSDIYLLLKALLPYLIIKKKEAEEVFEYVSGIIDKLPEGHKKRILGIPPGANT